MKNFELYFNDVASDLGIKRSTLEKWCTAGCTIPGRGTAKLEYRHMGDALQSLIGDHEIANFFAALGLIEPPHFDDESNADRMHRWEATKEVARQLEAAGA